jgi:dTDP-4-dehydrorhamnose 3,5-epimerase-like enzyme
MMMSESMIQPLTNYGDQRGFCFTLPPQVFNFLGTVQEMHVVELLPNAIRGNHYHQQRKEALIVVYEDDWLLAWRDLTADVAQQQVFSGRGAVLIALQANTAHAVKNIGQRKLVAVSCSNLDVMDTVRLVLIEF